MQFGSLLKALRERRSLTLRELSKLSGVDHAYIHCLECGKKRSPSAATLKKLSRALKASLPHPASGEFATTLSDNLE